MFRKYTKLLCIIMILIVSFSIVSCKKSTAIEFYKNYDEKTGTYSEKIEYIISGVTSYAVFKTKESFGKDNIGMSVYTTDEERSNVFNYFIWIDPQINEVVFDFEIYDAGMYEMIIYLDDDQDNPIAKRNFEVREE